MNIINKESYKILPYGITVIKTWPEDCFLFSLLSDTRCGNNWIADSNIQIILTHDIVRYFPLKKQHLFQNGFDFIPFIHKYAIDRKLLYSINENFRDIIIKSIDAGFYISGLFNKQALLGDGSEDINHVSYIYGYDENENVVYMNDNFFHGVNSRQRIPFDRVQKAFETALSGNPAHLGNRVINFYELNADMEYQLSKEKIKKGMTDYLNGTCDGEHRDNAYTFFGIKAYERLIRVVENNDDHDIDLRNVTFLCDIAQVNKIRTAAMVHSGLFETGIQNLSQNIDRQIEASELMVGLAMKYNAKKDVSILHRLAVLIKEFGQTEEAIADNIVRLSSCE